jgi:hypothetical protein
MYVWFPRALSFSKSETSWNAIALQQVLQSASQLAWRYFLTGDESWFYYAIDDDHAM